MAKQEICDGFSVDIDDGWRDKDSFEIKVYMEPRTISEMPGGFYLFQNWLNGWAIGRYHIKKYSLVESPLNIPGIPMQLYRVMVEGEPITEDDKSAWGFR